MTVFSIPAYSRSDLCMNTHARTHFRRVDSSKLFLLWNLFFFGRLIGKANYEKTYNNILVRRVGPRVFEARGEGGRARLVARVGNYFVRSEGG